MIFKPWSFGTPYSTDGNQYLWCGAAGRINKKESAHIYGQTVSTHTRVRPWNPHHSMITAISGDDGVLMSILMSTTSLGSQLADNYDRPRYYHNDSSVSAVKHQHWMLTFSVFLCVCCQPSLKVNTLRCVFMRSEEEMQVLLWKLSEVIIFFQKKFKEQQK